MKKSGKNRSTEEPKSPAKKAWETRRKNMVVEDLFSETKQKKIETQLEQNKIRDDAISAGPAAYREYLRIRSKYQTTERPDRVLILVPPKLLDRFQQLCNEESYTFNEGVREAMRRMMVELQENEVIKNETPERQQDSFEKLTKSLSRILKEEDPSILPSGIQGVL